MIRKFKIPFLVVFGIACLWSALAFIWPVQRVEAQCSTPSSCKTCHETQQQNPPAAKAWHLQHQTADFCSGCHNGNRDATDAASAHVGLLTSLDQMAGNCKACHASDFEEQYKLYAAELGVSDSSALTNIQIPGGIPLDTVEIKKPTPTVTAEPTPAADCTTVDNTPNQILILLLILGVFGGGSYILWNETRRRKAEKTSKNWAVWLLEGLRQPSWSPYVAGVLLGVTAILAVSLAGRILSASGPVATITSTLFHAVAPDAAKNNMYFSFVTPPGLTWGVVLFAGIFLGGLLGALSSKTWKLRWNDDATWHKIFGPQLWKRFLIGFLGAAIVQFGAGIAGGCTSGLAISGGMLLAPAAFLFMAGMFISGIIVAILVYGRRY